MKKLQKIRLGETSKVLTEQEMKLVRGGGSTKFYCERWKISGEPDFGTFTTDSAEVANAWLRVWDAHWDWMANCDIYYNMYT